MSKGDAKAVKAKTTMAQLSGTDLAGYEAQLNTLLEKAIQREQALGLVCADMKATIEQMKQNFVIEPGKLSFVECNSRKILAIPVAELEEYLLMKELFE